MNLEFRRTEIIVTLLLTKLLLDVKNTHIHARVRFYLLIKHLVLAPENVQDSWLQFWQPIMSAD